MTKNELKWLLTILDNNGWPAAPILKHPYGKKVIAAGWVDYIEPTPERDFPIVRLNQAGRAAIREYRRR